MVNTTKNKALTLKRQLQYLMESTNMDANSKAFIPTRSKFKSNVLKNIPYFGQNKFPHVHSADKAYKARMQYTISNYLYQNPDLANQLKLLSGIKLYKILVNKSGKNPRGFKQKHPYMKASIYNIQSAKKQASKNKLVSTHYPITLGTILKRVNKYLYKATLHQRPKIQRIRQELKSLVNKFYDELSDMKIDSVLSLPSESTNCNSVLAKRHMFGEKSTEYDDDCFTPGYDFCLYLEEHPALIKVLGIKIMDDEYLTIRKNGRYVKLNYIQFRKLLDSKMKQIDKKYRTEYAPYIKSKQTRHYMKVFKSFLVKVPYEDLKHNVWPVISATFRMAVRLKYPKVSRNHNK